MLPEKTRISTGFNRLNQILNSLFIGDNVIWYDDAGSLAAEFCMKFIHDSILQHQPVVYVSFDRSPKNLIAKLGPLAKNQYLTILDCFTNGKGDTAQVFNQFYEKDGAQWPYQVIRITRPDLPQAVSDAIYGLHRTLNGNVRFIFESLTGMADLWNGEDHVVKFYSHTCPQLYELDTIAYWIIEQGAHSSKLKAHINQIAQVVIALDTDQGKTRLTILKAENRTPKTIGTALQYSIADHDLFFGSSNRPAGPVHDIGMAIKAFRKSRGITQKELSQLVGVTPSNISQIERNQVYPSIPALYRIARHLSVDAGAFFQKNNSLEKWVFPAADAFHINLPTEMKHQIEILQLTPFEPNGNAQIFRVTIFKGGRLSSHFFKHKGDEIGYVLSGQATVGCQGQTRHLIFGDTVYLKTLTPDSWQNKTAAPFVMLWLTLG